VFEPVVEVTVVAEDAGSVLELVAEEEEVAVLVFELVVEVTVVVVVVAFVVVPVVTVGVVVVLNGVVVVPVPVVVVVVVVANVDPMRRGKSDDRKMDRLMNMIIRLFRWVDEEVVLFYSGNMGDINTYSGGTTTERRRWNDGDETV
jgi:hypothetical protein